MKTPDTPALLTQRVASSAREAAKTPRIERYGPWAIVTGASCGIGRSLAIELAAAGFNLVLVGRRKDSLATLSLLLCSKYAVETHNVVTDLATIDGPREVLTATAGLDVGLLVAAAGFGTSGELCHTDLTSEIEMLHVNCRAVLILVHQLTPRLIARGRGGIILFGSLVGFQGTPRAANYAATKSYILSLGEALRVELAPRNIQVIVSAPGPVHSGFAARAKMRMNVAESPTTVARATLRALPSGGTVIPGALSKFLTWSLLPLPRLLRVRIIGRIMSSMTKG